MRTPHEARTPAGRILVVLMTIGILAVAACGSGNSDADTGTASVTDNGESPSDSAFEKDASSEGIDPSEDEGLDEIDSPETGELSQTGAVLEQPDHDVEELPAAEPTWEPVSMIKWDLPQEEPDPVAPFALPLEATTVGGFTSNAFGCESRCITNAQLSFDPIRTDVGISVTTNVTTQKWVWILPPGPFVVNGVPVYVGKVAAAYTTSFGTSWSVDLTDLDSATKYRIVVGVKDNQGNTEYVTTEFTTVNIADQLVANGTGCYFQCIVSGVTEPTSSYSMVDLVVDTNTDAEFEFSVSKNQPGTLDGHPFMANQVQLTTVRSGARQYEMRAIGLEGDTTYHVVVKVTDELGQSQWATGSFKTDPAPAPRPPAPEPTDVFIALERLFVHNDGDAGSKGEIGFSWKIYTPGDYVEYLGVSTFDDGDGYTFPFKTGTWATVAPGQKTPLINVTAIEEDVVQDIYGCNAFLLIHEAPREMPSCRATANPAIVPPMYPDDMATLKRCSEWGITGAKGDEACLVMSSAYINDDYVVFDVLVSFTIAG